LEKDAKDDKMNTEGKGGTIGFLPIARTTFDIPLALEMASRVRKSLLGAGFALRGPEGLVTGPR
jgi:hypothetical protein